MPLNVFPAPWFAPGTPLILTACVLPVTAGTDPTADRVPTWISTTGIGCITLASEAFFAEEDEATFRAVRKYGRDQRFTP